MVRLIVRVQAEVEDDTPGNQAAHELHALGVRGSQRVGPGSQRVGPGCLE